MKVAQNHHFQIIIEITIKNQILLKMKKQKIFYMKIKYAILIWIMNIYLKNMKIIIKVTYMFR
jgi:hypothetical protein